jgi:cytochrome c oxidase assembly factor CtaG
MASTAQAILSSWSVQPATSAALAVCGLVYARGWRILRRAAPARFPPWRLGAFLAGLAALWLAISSPLDTLSGFLLAAHMVQHLLLLAVAPVLLLLAAPLLPLLRGLPRRLVREALGPFLAWPALRRLGAGLTHPVPGWLVMTFTLGSWNLPGPFDLALRSPGWHKAEHACFLAAALLFWWPVLSPWPSRRQWPIWAAPLYLLAGDAVNSVLSAILTFSDRVLYPVYASAPRLSGLSALDDQMAAGLIMWIPGSMIFLIPAVVIVVKTLTPAHNLVRPPGKYRVSLPISGRHRRPDHDRPFDLLTVPVIGPFLRAPLGRRALQAVLLVLALAVVLDGVLGPKAAPANLAGVLPWTYWRAMTVVGLLAAGNLFCMACPFMLPRDLGRRLGLGSRRWPRALRSKWLAVALLLLFFWAYEALGLWDRPAWTAALVSGYFGAAFVVDALFRNASFCKYVCPIGQFHFVTSLVSPLEVKVREPAVCAGCRTHDCLRGNERQRGCEMGLYLPRKVGNLDCTFCLDCVRACPHGNVGVVAIAPGLDIAVDPHRSSLGRLSRRPDIAALALVLVFAAFANAAAMVGPVARWRDALMAEWGARWSLAVTGLFFAIALVLAPAVLVGSAVAAGRALGRVRASVVELVCRFSMALVPLGSAMWAAHFLFHLLAGWNSAWPVFQRVAAGFGWRRFGEPRWFAPVAGFGPDSILALQTLLLDGGLLLTLYIGWRIARACAPRLRTALALVAPWAGVASALYCAGVWIFLQPMQMRGLFASAL